MKRLTALLAALSLTLTLTACSPNPSKPPFSLSLTEPLLQSDAFSEPLEPLDADLAWMLYGLDASGLTREAMTDLRSFRSSGATCEEVAVFLFSHEDAARTAADALKLYIAGQIRTNRDYRPTELPKLEKAVLERRGTTVLLVVANDSQAASALLAS